MVSGSKRYLLLISLIAVAVMISSSGVFASSSKVNNKKYTHPTFYKTSLYSLFHGVDVSYWQHSIDWKKSKADGIDFAIMRCGYTALNKFSLHQDSTFLTNYKNAKSAGVSVGIYYYACATTEAEAKKEANYVVSILKNNKINNQMPVVMDYEIDSGRANTTYKSLVKKKGKSYARKRFTKNAIAFMNTLRASGYEPMFYSYRVMVDPSFSSNYRFNMKDINGSNQYRFWLAQYSTSISYTGKMELWQFTSTGRVNGMKGNIDRNFWYYPLGGTGTAKGTTSIRQCTVTLSNTAYKYNGKIKQPKVTVKYGTTTLKEGTDYSVSYMNNIKKGTATVLVHGKGKYSNETYNTFKIGDSNNGANKTTVTDPSALVPKEVKEYKAWVDASNGAVKLCWKAAKNATKHQVVYKINGEDEWRRKSIDELSYTIPDLEPGTIVEVKVRGRNTNSEEVISGPYTEIKYLYVGTVNNNYNVNNKKKLTVTWNPLNDERGKFRYNLKISRVGGKSKVYKLDSTKKTVKLSAGKCYEAVVTPQLIIGDKIYTGAAGNVSRAFAAYTKFSTVKGIKGGIQLKWAKVKGAGKPRYKIIIADNPEMKNAKVITKAQKVNSIKVNKLDRKKTYYVTIRPYTRINKVVYYGSSIKSVKVDTK